MEIGRVVQQVQHVATVRADDAADRARLEDALRSVGQVRAWLDACQAGLTSQLSRLVSFPEQTLAECTRGSTRDAIKGRERAGTLDAVPPLAEALSEARLTAGHVDAVTNATKQLDGDEQRSELRDRIANGGLLDVAAAATVEQWRERLAVEVKNIQRSDGVDRLERQRRATRLRSWTDGDGMWCLSGRFDPLTGVKLAAKLEAATNALFAAAVPATCPTDGVEKQRHLQALALAHLLEHGAAAKPGRPEFVVVIDTSNDDGAGRPVVDWGIPVEIPHRMLAELLDDDRVAVHPVVVRNGVILHAPGELDLGRTTRLASPAQRRALRALYATCAIPGCGVRYDRCKLHHVIWWRHGGRTDLANLLPVCAQHHSQIHDAGWELTVGANRELSIRFPDGTVRNTGPPGRRAA